MRAILDTDTAGDDTIAILTALHHPNIQLEAITIVAGNVQFEQQMENALYTLEVAGKGGQVPVYPGSRSPLLGHHDTVEAVHGRDGMGDSFFAKAKQRPETTHAVDFIVQKVRENPGEISILAIGPLTNVASAIRREPALAKDLAHIYIMGGTNNSLGNITPAAEYNFWVDPEAARIVLTSGIPLTIVGWEMATQYTILDEQDHQEIAQMGTKGAQFFVDVNRVVMKFNRENHKLAGTTHPDTLLVAVAADPTLMTRFGDYYVDVELGGEFTRGYSVMDVHHVLRRPANARVCELVDESRFKTLVRDVLKSIS